MLFSITPELVPIRKAKRRAVAQFLFILRVVTLRLKRIFSFFLLVKPLGSGSLLRE